MSHIEKSEMLKNKASERKRYGKRERESERERWRGGDRLEHQPACPSVIGQTLITQELTSECCDGERMIYCKAPCNRKKETEK